MARCRNLNIVIFENDQVIARLLQVVLNRLGYNQIKIFTDPSLCPLYAEPSCNCPVTKPCADVLISDINMPRIDGLDFFRDHDGRGCQIILQNKALMSAGVTPEQQTLLLKSGYHFIKKPFEIDKLGAWLQDCEQRVVARKHRGKGV